LKLSARLDAFVEACLADRVVIIAVVGPDADHEDFIEELVVGDASNDSRFVMISSHHGWALQEALEFLFDLPRRT
jgi:hypothetical protein